MGWSIYRPHDKVKNDPSVQVYTEVRAVAQVNPLGGKMLSSSDDGILYVQDKHLYYETIAKRELCCSYFKKSWKLSDIKEVRSVVDEDVLVVMKKSVTTVSLNPGLKITFVKDSPGSQKTLVVSTTNVKEFSSFLTQHIQRVVQ